MDRLTYGLIGIFLLLFGLLAVTNIKIESMVTIMGLAALAAGIICIVRVALTFRGPVP